jgi:hypothetical protein
MRRKLFILVIVMIVAMCGVIWLASSPASRTPKLSMAPMTEVQFCVATFPAVEPADAPWFCRNHAGIYKIHWSQWTTRGATGIGVVQLGLRASSNEKTWTNSRAHIFLFNARREAHHVLFRSIRMVFLDHPPLGIPRMFDSTLPWR